MLGVEPDGFGIEGVIFSKVDDGIGAVDAFESESGGELVESEELAVVLGRPAEEAEEIDEGLGQEAGIAIGGDADDGAVLALGELGAIGGDQQGEMGELGRLGAEGLEDEQVLEGVGEVILAADDVADARDRRRRRRRRGGRWASRLSAAGRSLPPRRRAWTARRRRRHEVQGAALAARHAIAQGERLARGGAAVAFFAGSSRMPGLKSQAPCAEDFFVGLRVGRREVAIGKALGEDGFGLLAVQGKALGLLVLFVPGRPSQRSPSKMDWTLASVLRSTSVSSRRNTMVPSLWRA